MLKPHSTNYKKCFTTLLFILFFIGLLPPNLNGQVKIKEKVELQRSKGIENFIWPINGCEYEVYDSSEYTIHLAKQKISPGNSTTFTIWSNDMQYFESDDELIYKEITMEPDYGEITEIGDTKYLISIPDTVTSDSVLITIHYNNFQEFCGYPVLEKNIYSYFSNKSEHINSCIYPCPQDPNFPPNYAYLINSTAMAELIVKPDSFVVYIDPEECYPGDTVQVVIKKRNADGTLADFPPEQMYEIAKLEGCMLGNILADNDSGSYFLEAAQPIYFAAADTLVGDTTGTVLLQVGLVDSEKKKELPLDHPTHIESNDCFIGSFISESNMITDVPIIEPIRIAWDQETFNITIEPEMPTLLTIWLQPKNYVGAYTIDWDLEIKWTNTEQSPEKIFKYTFHNNKTANTAGGTDLPLPNNDPTIVGGDEITLSGIYYDFRYPNGYEFEKKLTGMKILGKDAENHIQIVKDYINAHDFPQPINLPLSEVVTPQDQRKQMEIIVEKETYYFQFFDERMIYHTPPPEKYGYTYTNTSSDWGLSQLHTSEPTIAELWNWKANINSGIHFLWTEKFDQLKYDGYGGGFYEIKERLHKNGIEVPNLNRQEFLVWLAQRYHGGHYYNDYTPGKKGIKGTWVKNSEHRSYGDDFCDRFGFSKCE